MADQMKKRMKFRLTLSRDEVCRLIVARGEAESVEAAEQVIPYYYDRRPSLLRQIRLADRYRDALHSARTYFESAGSQVVKLNG